MNGKGNAPDSRRDDDTPDEVIVNMEPRSPDFDPTLGIPVAQTATLGTSMNKLVTIGDSVTMGFQSGDIFNTKYSWPKIVAAEIGCDPGFRFPLYESFGGLPANIEYLVRSLEHTYGSNIDLWELPGASFRLRHLMSEIADYWQLGAGVEAPLTSAIMHNLAICGWDIRDALSRTAKNLKDFRLTPKKNSIKRYLANAKIRAGLGVYSSMDETDTLLDAARKLGDQGAKPGSGGDAATPGIETLVVFLGANNVLASVVLLDVQWSGPGFDQLSKEKDEYTVWCPSHFKSEYLLLVNELKKVKAQHVILVNVPHVTIAPIARGVREKVQSKSRYYPYYTRPWISDAQFNPDHDPHITENQARAIDSAVDQYNDVIADVVRERRRAGQDWYVMDIAGMLDRLVHPRYIKSPDPQPTWWTPYDLPEAFNSIDPTPDSRFFASDSDGRMQGGLFSLDGVHPSTIGYSLIAQEIINIMQLANVPLYFGDGKTLRPGPVKVDFERWLRADSLNSNPPASLSSDLKTFAWLDATADLLTKFNHFKDRDEK